MITKLTKKQAAPTGEARLVLVAEADAQNCIHLVRGRRVILDADLAEFYGVLIKNLNKAVDRNLDRFPEDFSFQLTWDETVSLKSQMGAIQPEGRGGARKPARVFTEQGVAMLASVLRGPRAAAISIAIVRVFVQLRELISTHRDLSAKFAELEHRVAAHDEAIANLFEAIRQLLEPPPPPSKPPIGFNYVPPLR